MRLAAASGSASAHCRAPWRMVRACSCPTAAWHAWAARTGSRAARRHLPYIYIIMSARGRPYRPCRSGSTMRRAHSAEAIYIYCVARQTARPRTARSACAIPAARSGSDCPTCRGRGECSHAPWCRTARRAATSTSWAATTPRAQTARRYIPTASSSTCAPWHGAALRRSSPMAPINCKRSSGQMPPPRAAATSYASAA